MTTQPQQPSAPVVRVKTMHLSDGHCDYFVSIKVGDREITPFVFKEEYKAAYEVAVFDWLLNGAEEPRLLDYGPGSFPEYERTRPVTAVETGGADNVLLSAVKALLKNDGGPGAAQYEAHEFAKARKACQEAISAIEGN